MWPSLEQQSQNVPTNLVAISQSRDDESWTGVILVTAEALPYQVLDGMDRPFEARRPEDIIWQRDPDALLYESFVEGKTCRSMPRVTACNV